MHHPRSQGDFTFYWLHFIVPYILSDKYTLLEILEMLKIFLICICRWLLVFQYNFFIVIVPYCYVNIYYFRKNLKIPGTDKNVVEKRKKRNIVTFSYNMLVWIIEALLTIIVRIASTSFILFKELIWRFTCVEYSLKIMSLMVF